MFAIIEKLVIKNKLRIIETTICELPGSEDLLYVCMYIYIYIYIYSCGSAKPHTSKAMAPNIQ